MRAVADSPLRQASRDLMWEAAESQIQAGQLFSPVSSRILPCSRLGRGQENGGQQSWGMNASKYWGLGTDSLSCVLPLFFCLSLSLLWILCSAIQQHLVQLLGDVYIHVQLPFYYTDNGIRCFVSLNRANNNAIERLLPCPHIKSVFYIFCVK